MKIKHNEVTVEEENLDDFPRGAHLLKLENPVSYQEDSVSENGEGETQYVILASGGGAFGSESAVFPATEDGNWQNQIKLGVGKTMEQAIDQFIREHIETDTENWIVED